MAIQKNNYSEGLIRAIDKWQLGSKDKARKARRIRDLSRHLPLKYRTAPTYLFRQVRINAQLGIGIALDCIPDAVSSWTTSLEVAQQFRMKEYDRNKVLIIFRRMTHPDDIILNLNELYNDPDFIETVLATESRLGCKFQGISRWGGDQQEVIIRETIIRNDEIMSFGAFRLLTDVAPVIGTRDPNAPSDSKLLRELTGSGEDEYFWTQPLITPEATKKLAERTREFLIDKRLWPGEQS